MTKPTDEHNDGSSKATVDGEVVATFANHPVSLTEHKATKASDAALWTPRDALIDMLRRIDAGEFKQPRAVIIALDYADDEGDGAMAYNISSPNFLTSVGLAGRVFYSVNERGDL